MTSASYGQLAWHWPDQYRLRHRERWTDVLHQS